MSITKSLTVLALGSALFATFTPANAGGTVYSDGWQQLGDSLVFVGHAQGTGKSRAQVQAELAAWVKNPVSHDGFREIGGDSIRYVGTDTSTKTRAEVRAELAAWIKDPVSHDGYSEIGGDSARYVGRSTSAADVQLAAGNGKAPAEAVK